MAEFKTKHGGYSLYETILYVNQISQSVDKNTSTLQYRLVTIFSGGSGAWNNDPTSRVVISINGNEVFNQNLTYDFRSAKSKTWATGTVTIPHNSDGTKSVGVSFSINGDNSYFGNPSSSGTMALTTIPRATTPTLSSNTVTMGSQVTINLPRASASFTHNLHFKFGSGSLQSIANGVGTSYSWTPPVSLASNLPNATSGKFTIYVYTMNSGKQVGLKTIDITLTVPSNIVPNLTQNISGNNLVSGHYIQGHSQVKVTLNASGSYGSSIKSRSTVIIFNSRSLQSNNSNNFTSNTLSNSGTHTIRSTVTDSRGRSVTRTSTINVLSYSPPRLTGQKAYRSTSTGAAQDDGGYGTVSGTASFTNFSGNVLIFKADYRRVGVSNWTNIFNTTNITSASTTSSKTVYVSLEYDFEVKITLIDKLRQVEYFLKIDSDKVIMDFHNSGTGVSFGKTSQSTNTVEISNSWALIGSSPREINAENLDDITTTGTYIQRYSANTSLSKNYPIQVAGMLEVTSTADKNHSFQTYTSYDGKYKLSRSKYASNPWSPWRAIALGGENGYLEFFTPSTTINHPDMGIFGTKSGNVIQLVISLPTGWVKAQSSNWVTLGEIKPQYRVSYPFSASVAAIGSIGDIGKVNAWADQHGKIQLNRINNSVEYRIVITFNWISQ